MNTPEGFGKIETKEDTVPLQDYLDVVNQNFVLRQKVNALLRRSSRPRTY